MIARGAGLAYTRAMKAEWAAALAPLAALGATLWLTGRARLWLGARAILDRPVARSSHAAPVPRGGGLAVVPVLLAGWLAIALAGFAPAGTITVLCAAAALAAVSWVDDLRGLPAGLRLAAHVAAAAIGVAALPASAMVFQGTLPPLLDRAGAALVWVWFVNLYNFMDGIDGLTGTETACLGLGIALVLALSGGGATAPALTAAAAAIGFLRWNWRPAQIFLGDVGSVPLGYLLGWLLFNLAAAGRWESALILPLYYLADASLTLARRVQRGEPFWRAHREHFYQRALGRDGDHGAVVRIILAGDLVLIALAAFALLLPLPALALAILATAALLLVLKHRGEAPHDG